MIRIATLALIAILGLSLIANAQVSEIRTASSGHSHSGESRSGSSSADMFWFQIAINSWQIFAEAQREKLMQRSENPAMVSLDIIGNVGAQPSSYYIVNPRLRGNWGIFSTDFRMNYIIEESVDGVKHVRTTDWQIVELNLVCKERVNFYVGAGIITEAYGDHTTYDEYTAALNLNPRKWPVGIYTEYRYSQPRLEFNGQLRRQLYSGNSMRIFLHAGVVWQQYYSTVTVWGLQGGFTVKVF